jgi:hypothetical protein
MARSGSAVGGKTSNPPTAEPALRSLYGLFSLLHIAAFAGGTVLVWLALCDSEDRVEQAQTPTVLYLGRLYNLLSKDRIVYSYVIRDFGALVKLLQERGGCGVLFLVVFYLGFVSLCRKLYVIGRI